MKQELDEFNDGDASWSVGPMSEELRYHVVFLFKVFIGPNKTFIIITKQQNTWTHHMNFYNLNKIFFLKFLNFGGVVMSKPGDS